MRYTVMYAHARGRSHFQDAEIELRQADFAPPLNLSTSRQAAQCACAAIPLGWRGDRHQAPWRQRSARRIPRDGIPGSPSGINTWRYRQPPTCN